MLEGHAPVRRHVPVRRLPVAPARRPLMTAIASARRWGTYSLIQRADGTLNKIPNLPDNHPSVGPPSTKRGERREPAPTSASRSSSATVGAVSTSTPACSTGVHQAPSSTTPATRTSRRPSPEPASTSSAADPTSASRSTSVSAAEDRPLGQRPVPRDDTQRARDPDADISALVERLRALRPHDAGTGSRDAAGRIRARREVHRRRPPRVRGQRAERSEVLRAVPRRVAGPARRRSPTPTSRCVPSSRSGRTATPSASTGSSGPPSCTARSGNAPGLPERDAREGGAAE